MRFAAFFICSFALHAQSAGLAPASETGKLFTDLAAQSTRLQPLIQQLKPNEWVAAGAPKSVAALWQTAASQNQALSAQAGVVARTPEKLADSLRLLEQLHTVEESVAELLPSVAQYQNPALAQLIAGMEEEGKPARDAYAQRVLDLAAEREAQFEIADHEAQRCREILSKEPRGGARAVKSK